MRQVALAEFKDQASKFFAAVEAGEEIEVTRRGRVVARVIPPAESTLEERRRILSDIVAFGRRNRDKHGPTTAAEIRQWIEDDRS